MNDRSRALRWLTLALVLGAAATFLSLWPSLVLGVWTAAIARPAFRRIASALGGRGRAASVVVVVLVLVATAPIVLATISLVRGAIDLVHVVSASNGGKAALISLASGSEGDGTIGSLFEPLKSPQKLLELAKDYGGGAFSVAFGIAGGIAEALLAVFVFLYGVYVFLVDGPALYTWMEERAPIAVSQVRRLRDAFLETGRGLFVGVGATGLAQGVVATIAYLALGVPRALVLGLVTCIASLLPSIGTALVWVPVTIGLALAGKPISAAILAGVGVLVISTIDNLIRPVFARYGNLKLSTFALMTSIFGGLAIFGPSGLILGPLLVRMAKEALDLVKESKSEADTNQEA